MMAGPWWLTTYGVGRCVRATFVTLLGGFGLFVILACGANAEQSSSTRKQLVDVVDGMLFDGWGEKAVETLSIYYTGDSSSDVQMLGYRPSIPTPKGSSDIKSEQAHDLSEL
jgi:hypothetical protein